MNIIIFDTETISVDKPFCYNIGYIIYDTDGQQVLVERDFVVEQVWHNRPLFETAYYAHKRPLYVSSMRARQTEMDKYGYIQQQMIRDIRNFKVDGAYAFNCKFDDMVFDFNSDYFKCSNALDNIPVFDIRGYACKFLMTDGYKKFLNDNADKLGADGKSKKFITESDGYKTTAESFYCYLTGETDFDEAHTALADSRIELEILLACINEGATWQTEYKVARSYPRNRRKRFTLKVDGEVVQQVDYIKKVERKVADGVVVSLT